VRATASTAMPENQGEPWPALDALRESQLLSEDQLGQLQQPLAQLDLQGVEDLVLAKGWLTAYQWNRILEGEGRGLVLGQYRIVDELGRGGFGTVFKAVHRIMNRVAAIKVLTPKRRDLDERRELFLREVLATTRLTHPNIALAYEANQTEDTLWFAMEYVNGPSLDQFVKAGGALPVPFVCKVMLQVAEALQYAHEQGMVHRDIKPANLLLPGAQVGAPLPPYDAEPAPVLVKVVDFGLVRVFPSADCQLETICKDVAFVGTPAFTSPEQAQDSHEVDIRSDLYSLGCTFYYALTGKRPFEGATVYNTIVLHMEEEAQPVRLLRPEVPAAVADIVRRLMAKKPEQRFATPADLRDALAVAMRTPPRQGGLVAACGPDQVPAPNVEEQPPPVHATSTRSIGGSTTMQRHAGGQALDTMRVGREALPLIPANVPRNKLILALWDEWVALVEAVAHRTLADWNEYEYAQVHESLLAALREASACPSDPCAPLYARLESCAEPWVTLRALGDLDRTMLLGLCETCRRLHAELAPGRRVPLGVWILFVVLLVGSALGALCYFRGVKVSDVRRYLERSPLSLSCSTPPHHLPTSPATITIRRVV
jgi:eukaryotic-like serine/threonine-protein kinase